MAPSHKLQQERTASLKAEKEEEGPFLLDPHR